MGPDIRRDDRPRGLRVRRFFKATGVEPIVFNEGVTMKEQKNQFLKGLRDGVPICLGYLSVAFAFGIFSIGEGLEVWEAVLISMTNVTSAGQLAGVPIIAGGGSLIELAATQLVINLRYALMSVSLSQKVDDSVRPADRFIIAFVNTDEVFAVASGQEGSVGRRYLYGLILTPYLGWSLGTLVGAVAGNILPPVIVSALGIAIYGMFIAVVIPPAKRSRPTALCVLLAVALSCAFRYLPGLNAVPGGFVIILCAVAASALFAGLAPLPEREEGEGSHD